MATPTYDSTKHSVSINSKGYMVAPTGAITRGDAVPAFSRAALGEGRFDQFQVDSFVAQADWSGGQGQARLVANDRFLSGIGDSRWPGHFFPARKKITESDGGTTSYFFRIGTTLYGLTAGFIETIGTATSVARTAGTINCRPIVSGANNAFWVRAGTTVDRWIGSGSTTDVTPPGVTPAVVARYGRFIWCIGTRSLESDGTFVQSASRSPGQNSSVTVTLASAPKSGNVLVAIIHAANSSGSSSWMPTDTGWQAAELFEGSSANIELRAFVKTVTSARDNTHRFETTGTSSAPVPYVTILEFSGCDSVAPYLDSSSSEDTVADTTLSGSALGANTYGAVVNAWVTTTSDAASSHTNSFTELVDAAFNSSANRAVVSYKVQTTSTGSSATAAGSTEDLNVVVGLRPNAITSDQTQTCFVFSRDEGASWEEVFFGDSAGIPVPTAAHASGGFLWLTTPQGLYQAAVEEHEFEDHTKTVNLAIRGPVDEWSVPFDTASIGTWLTSWDGQIYYNVGGTIRRFSPGGGGAQIWPTPEWGTITGKVQSIAQGEGGIYFGACGYLWNYDGRGFHALATEPNSSDFDFLYWHAGRLYFNDDPASYFDFKYPSSRPDISYTAATNFTTGYMVTSMWDYDKTNQFKVIRHFEIETEWSTAANAGTLTLEYAIADTGVHPERYGGGVTTGVTWTSIGTMTISDGNYKSFTLGTPLEAKSHWLRLTIAPGADGYPIPQAVIADGRAIMPAVKRIVMPLDISTDTTDLVGVFMYPTQADVVTARAELLALRAPSASPRYFTVIYRLDDGTAGTYVATAEQEQDSVNRTRTDKGSEGLFNFVILELP